MRSLRANPGQNMRIVINEHGRSPIPLPLSRNGRNASYYTKLEVVSYSIAKKN